MNFADPKFWAMVALYFFVLFLINWSNSADWQKAWRKEMHKSLRAEDVVKRLRAHMKKMLRDDHVYDAACAWNDGKPCYAC